MMKGISLSLVAIGFACCATSGYAQAGIPAVRLASPDGRLAITIGTRDFSTPLAARSQLYYSVELAGEPLVAHSPIQLRLRGAPPIGGGLAILDTMRRAVDEHSELAYGKTRYLHDFCNEYQILLQETDAPHRTIRLTARAYDDAVAFRLHLPRQPQLKEIAIEAEHTLFDLRPGAAYVLPFQNFRHHYENNYSVQRTEAIDPATLIALPLLVHLDSGPWIAISEADLEDYAGMYLAASEAKPGAFISRLAPLPADTSLVARLATPHDLPWRVFMVADHPGHMIESNVIMNLSDRSVIEKTDWIRPGKVAWPWWSARTVEGRDFLGGMNTATMKHYIDFASAAELEYLLIDADWYGRHNDPGEDITTSIAEIDLPEILSYANEKGVDIILWVMWANVRDQMELAFPLYERWGVKGVKVDYMNRDDQEMVNFYERVVALAARYHLTVDFHGAYKPTGLRRKYPNLLTREGVLGLEYSKWSDRCTPEHEVILPYTRMLAGPMDFTPGAFNVGTRATFRHSVVPPMAQGTRAHQLAMYVVYESPLQMLVDHPTSYLGQPGLEFLKVVPTVWDETHFISGAVGDYIVVARRKGVEWYVGAMTDWTARDLSIPLAFLGDGRYLAQLYSDSSDGERDPTTVAVRMEEVTREDSLDVWLAPGGGCAIRIVPTWTP